MDNDRIKLELLTKEHEHAWEDIRLFMGTNEKVMGLGFTLLGTGLALGFKEQIKEIMIFLPIAVLAILFYSMYNLNVIMTLGGYKKYIEEKINNEINENILIWEDIVKDLHHNNIIAIFLYLIYTIFFLATIYLSLINSWKYYGITFFIIYSFILLLLIIGLVISLIKMSRSFKYSYNLVSNKYSLDFTK